MVETLFYKALVFPATCETDLKSRSAVAVGGKSRDEGSLRQDSMESTSSTAVFNCSAFPRTSKESAMKVRS